MDRRRFVIGGLAALASCGTMLAWSPKIRRPFPVPRIYMGRNDRRRILWFTGTDDTVRLSFWQDDPGEPGDTAQEMRRALGALHAQGLAPQREVLGGALLPPGLGCTGFVEYSGETFPPAFDPAVTAWVTSRPGRGIALSRPDRCIEIMSLFEGEPPSQVFNGGLLDVA